MEPARNTVKEYDAMKKLIVPKNQGRARIYDQHMQKVRNDKFFQSLRNQKPVYNVKEWEKDYEHQVYSHMLPCRHCVPALTRHVEMYPYPISFVLEI